MLSSTDALLHLLGHTTFSAKRRQSYWPIDAWQIITRRTDLDWARLVEETRTSRLALPAFTLLRYLATELAAPVPPSVLAKLAATTPDSLEREGSLFGAQATANWSYARFLRQAGDWRARGQVLQWILLPSPAYLSNVSGVRRSPTLPLYYVTRLLRQAGRELLTRRQRLSSPRQAVQSAAAGAPAPPARE